MDLVLYVVITSIIGFIRLQQCRGNETFDTMEEVGNDIPIGNNLKGIYDAEYFLLIVKQLGLMK